MADILSTAAETMPTTTDNWKAAGIAESSFVADHSEWHRSAYIAPVKTPMFIAGWQAWK